MGINMVCWCVAVLVGLFMMPVAFAQAECISDPLLSAEDMEVLCDGIFENAQLAIQTIFQNINAYDVGCAEDMTDRIRVDKINWVKPNGRYIVPLDIEKLTENLEVFSENEYDYTVGKTQKLFHYCLLFKPGVYEIYYYILGDDEQPIDSFRAKRKQVIIINNKCDGCLGVLSCNGCSGCRDKYIPEFVQQQNLKSLLGDWLLIGLSVLLLVSWNVYDR